MKLLHAADFHLDSPMSGLDREKSAQRRGELRELPACLARLAGEEGMVAGSGDTASYVLNTNSKKFHKPDCSNAASISAGNREDYTGDRSALLDDGYSPCGQCKP